jgi:hypothetical protein
MPVPLRPRDWNRYCQKSRFRPGARDARMVFCDSGVTSTADRLMAHGTGSFEQRGALRLVDGRCCSRRAAPCPRSSGWRLPDPERWNRSIETGSATGR